MTAQLHADLVLALARHPHAVRTNTPLDVLASHMLTSLQLLEATLLERSAHPFFAPGRPRVPDPPPADDPRGLYRDRPGPACPSCEDD
jgi:hypothetical protein